MKTNKKGFTLIELMVVIAIIGILASVILIGMSSSRDKAKSAKMQIELKQQWATAIYKYNVDHGTSPCNGEGSVTDCLAGALAPYGNLSTVDPWGHTLLWHNPGCCRDECTMVLSAGPDGKFCADGGYNCEHTFDSSTQNCTAPNSSYDDVGVYLGKVRDND